MKTSSFSCVFKIYGLKHLSIKIFSTYVTKNNRNTFQGVILRVDPSIFIQNVFLLQIYWLNFPSLHIQILSTLPGPTQMPFHKTVS